MSLLEIEGLNIGYRTSRRLIEKFSLSIGKMESVALVGESGSGKTSIALAIMGLLPPSSRFSGSIKFGDEQLLGMKKKKLNAIRGNQISMIFQEPMVALNPLHRVGRQIGEALEIHSSGGNRQYTYDRVIQAMKMAGLDDAQGKYSRFPHELSGGERQRAVIALALINSPRLLIADEPTSSLDATIACKIVSLLNDLRKKLSMSLLLISHDLNLVSKICERVAVLKDGKIVENSTVKKIFSGAQDSYTKFLLSRSHDRKLASAEGGEQEKNDAVRASSLSVNYYARKGLRKVVTKEAVIDANFEILGGHTLGVVGESGSGKTSLGLALLRLISVASGYISLGDIEISALSGPRLREHRSDMQIVFQDPFASLNPRLSAGEIIAEGLYAHRFLNKTEIREKVIKTLGEVGLPADSIDRYPHEFSGGQRQRIAIGRAIILNPRFIVLDEPTSALDVSVSVNILDLLKRLQETHRTAYLFISHDFNVIRSVADYIAVMKSGRIVELGKAGQIFSSPRHRYTIELLDAAMALSSLRK